MKMKDTKAIIPLIFLFMLLLLLSLLLLSSFSSLPPSTFSFPSSSRRSGLMKKKKSISDVDEKIWMQHHDFQKKERMDIEEIEDYTGTGANNHHDPGSPPGTTT